MKKVKAYEQKKCFYCSSPITKKNGRKYGKQQYKCYSCGKQFTGGNRNDYGSIYTIYSQGKQTYSDLAKSYGVSESTIKRKINSSLPSKSRVLIPGRVVVLADTTYWGRNWDLLVLLNACTGELLWRKYVKHERLIDYKEGIDFLESIGFHIEGIVCDGLKGIFKQFSCCKVQMCQFHQAAIIRRYITISPKLEAGKELKAIVKLLPKTDKESFVGLFDQWLEKWKGFLKERRIDAQTGKSRYVHRKLRSAYLSIQRNLPYLFVYLENIELNMPNTNNKLEGTFSDLKNKLRCHNGLTKENRKRFIDEFFKA